jgi:hypothetical protein
MPFSPDRPAMALVFQAAVGRWSVGWVWYCWPMPLVQVAVPVGVMVRVQPPWCLRRWWRWQRVIRLGGWVGPPWLKVVMWSRWQRLAVVAQPGKRQVPSRVRTKRAVGALGW